MDHMHMLYLALYPVAFLAGGGLGYWLAYRSGKWAAAQLDHVWGVLHQLPEELQAKLHVEFQKLGL